MRGLLVVDILMRPRQRQKSLFLVVYSVSSQTKNQTIIQKEQQKKLCALLSFTAALAYLFLHLPPKNVLHLKS